jgi:predicted nucleic acid-binding protein
MELLLYSAAWCRDCREAKRFLATHSIPFTEIVEELSRETVLPSPPSWPTSPPACPATTHGLLDALIVEAAIHSGTKILYTEDMHHGTRYGALELCNPSFA